MYWTNKETEHYGLIISPEKLLTNDAKDEDIASALPYTGMMQYPYTDKLRMQKDSY